MSEHIDQDTTPKETNPIELPDGIGLSIEEVRSHIAKVHETIVPKDDPILLLVTMLNLFLCELEKLQVRYGKGISKILSDKTDGYVQGVHAATDSLAQSLSDASIDAIRKMFSDHAAYLTAFKTSIAWMTALIVLSALINVTVFILR